MRPATEDDWPAIASILEENKLPLDGARENVSSYLAAIIDYEVVGCAGVEVYGNSALLRSVAVVRRMQRRGIGRVLVRGVIQEAAGRQITKFYLLTTTADYFARFGFQRTPIEQAPDALYASAEFQGACPTSAVFMSLTASEALTYAGPR